VRNLLETTELGNTSPAGEKPKATKDEEKLARTEKHSEPPSFISFNPSQRYQSLVDVYYRSYRYILVELFALSNMFDFLKQV
jgi:hypothetical protein